MAVPWKKSSLLINVRCDSLVPMMKPFISSLKSQRVLVPVNGYFEWKESKKHIPFYFTRADDSSDTSPLLFIAGFATDKHSKEDGILQYFIVTIEATESFAGVHHRMPLILCRPEDQLAWLQNGDIKDLLNDFSLNQSKTERRMELNKQLKMFRVSSKVNKIEYDTPEATEPVDESDTAENAEFKRRKMWHNFLEYKKD